MLAAMFKRSVVPVSRQKMAKDVFNFSNSGSAIAQIRSISFADLVSKHLRLGSVNPDGISSSEAIDFHRDGNFDCYWKDRGWHSG